MVNFPGSADSLSNPAGTDAVANANPLLKHGRQHADVNDIVELLEAKIGFSESAAQDSPLANTILASLTNGKSKYTQLVNAMVSASAAIAYSKLALANSILNADIAAAAAIAVSKLAAGAANQFLQTNSAGNAVAWVTQLLADLGSATSPTYSFTTRSNDGMYSSAAHEISLVTGGNQRVIVTDNGVMLPAASGTPTANAAYRESVVKTFIAANAAGSILMSHNVSSITDGGVGILTVNMMRGFASANYCVVASALADTSATDATTLVAMPQITGFSTSQFTIKVGRASDGALTDPTTFNAMAMGVQS